MKKVFLVIRTIGRGELIFASRKRATADAFLLSQQIEANAQANEDFFFHADTSNLEAEELRDLMIVATGYGPYNCRVFEVNLSDETETVKIVDEDDNEIIVSREKILETLECSKKARKNNYVSCFR